MLENPRALQIAILPPARGGAPKFDPEIKRKCYAGPSYVVEIGAEEAVRTGWPAGFIALPSLPRLPRASASNSGRRSVRADSSDHSRIARRVPVAAGTNKLNFCRLRSSAAEHHKHARHPLTN